MSNFMCLLLSNGIHIKDCCYYDLVVFAHGVVSAWKII